MAGVSFVSGQENNAGGFMLGYAAPYRVDFSVEIAGAVEGAVGIGLNLQEYFFEKKLEGGHSMCIELTQSFVTTGDSPFVNWSGSQSYACLALGGLLKFRPGKTVGLLVGASGGVAAPIGRNGYTSGLGTIEGGLAFYGDHVVFTVTPGAYLG